ncbi:MAG: hypothetical protein IJ471_00680 [Eubacterium sp.]|nr:hypothetical protein [Eubacterium sp.]
MEYKSQIFDFISYENGVDGTGVKEIVTQFYLSTSKEEPTGGKWSETQDTWSSGMYLWTRQKITYVDAEGTETLEYTTPCCDSSWEAVNGIEVGGTNLIKNSNFAAELDEWGTQVSLDGGSVALETEDGVTCLHISNTNVLATNIYAQDILAKVSGDLLNQSYVLSADVMLDNYVAGTNPCIQIKTIGTYYDENGDNQTINETYDLDTLLHIEEYAGKGWVRLHSVFHFDAVPNKSMGLDILAHRFTGDLYITNIQLERGTKPTDWSPAPEDANKRIDANADAAYNAQQTANGADSKAGEALSKIQVLAEQVVTYVQDETGNTKLTQTANGWEFSITDTQSTLKSATDAIASLDTANQALSGAVTDLVNEFQVVQPIVDKETGWMRIGEDENGQPCIELGEADSDFRIQITNTEIRFYDGQTPMAYMTNRKVYIEDAVVKQSIQFGGYMFAFRQNGNCGFYWKGAIT